MIQRQVALAPLNSFRVGGEAEYFIAPRQINQLQQAVQWARAHVIPITLLGAGSNLLISDRGLPGLVICTRHLRGCWFDTDQAQLTAVAGEPIVKLAWQAAELGWQGLAWAVGIPGTVGGAVVMNAGAQGGCIADILVSARMLHPDGTVSTAQNSDLGYAYRTSILQSSPEQSAGDRPLVLEATFQLEPGHDPAQLTAITRQLLEHRHNTQPYNLPSCGSVFRNPSPYTAGWLIEQTGLKGYQIGGAQVSTLHANFIVNRGGATASDILKLIQHIQTQVEHRWAIHLQPEVKQLGEF
jgi:UDP-N-acetylmuramate dehydrogenase